MNPELSRRVAKLMRTDTVLNLSSSERFYFVKEVDEAVSFDFLSDKAKAIIEDAENEEK